MGFQLKHGVNKIMFVNRPTTNGSKIKNYYWSLTMLGDISKAEHIYIAVGYTDMRKQIDGLSAIVQQNFKFDPFSNSVFLFCGRNTRIMKALYWEGDGFVLLYKRLENGKFKWPRDASEAREITPQQFRWNSLLYSLRPFRKVIHKLYCEALIS